MKSSLTTLYNRSERELQPREVRPRAVGPPLPAAGGRAHRGLLRRDVRRHVQALLEGERRLDLLSEQRQLTGVLNFKKRPNLDLLEAPQLNTTG